MSSLWPDQGDSPPPTTISFDEIPPPATVSFDETPPPAAPPGLIEKALSMLQSGAASAATLGGLRTGAMKGALTMTRNAGDLAGKIPVSVFTGGVVQPGETKFGGPSIADTVASLLGFKADLSKPLAEESANGLGESLGKLGTEGVPAMASGGILPMAAAGSAASLLAGARDPGKVALGGAVNATLGAAGKMLSETVLPKIAASDFVTSKVNRIINMPVDLFKSEVAKLRSPGKILQAEGMPADATQNVATMFSWVKDRTDQIGKGISAAVADIPQGTKVPGWQIVDDIVRDAAKKAQSGLIAVKGEAGRAKLLEDLEALRKGVLGSMPIRSTGAPATGLFKGGIHIEPADILTAKQELGANINWKAAGGPIKKASDFIEHAKADIYSALGDSLAKLSPDLRALNTRYSSMVKIQSALETQRAKFLARDWPKLKIADLLRSAMGTRATMALSRGVAPGAGTIGPAAQGAGAAAVNTGFPEDQQ